MMDDGGPAFPFQDITTAIHGMSLRDWFAGQAMAALIPEVPVGTGGTTYAHVAEWAYLAADEMLAEREKEWGPARNRKGGL